MSQDRCLITGWAAASQRLRALPVLLAAVLTLGLAQPATAQAPNLPGVTAESRAAARELLVAMNYSATAGQMLTGLRTQMVSIIAQVGGKPQPEAEKIVDEVLFPEFQSRIGEMQDLTIEIYASNLTAGEMRELRAFYNTPIGKRLLVVTPKLGVESFTAGRVWGERVAQEAFRKHANELRRRGVTL